MMLPVIGNSYEDCAKRSECLSVFLRMHPMSGVASCPRACYVPLSRDSEMRRAMEPHAESFDADEAERRDGPVSGEEIGARFGTRVVVSKRWKRCAGKLKPVLSVVCDCGYKHELIDYRTKSRSTCPRCRGKALHAEAEAKSNADLVGVRFGRRTIMSVQIVRQDGIAYQLAKVKCDCGDVSETRVRNLKAGRGTMCQMCSNSRK